MVLETDDLVNDLMSILKPTQSITPSIKEVITPKKEKITNKAQPIKSERTVKLERKLTPKEVSHGFLDGILESENPSQKANVYISQDIYEIFVTLKRAKKIKNVTILLDYALKDFIKRNAQDIKTLLYDSQNNEIL